MGIFLVKNVFEKFFWYFYQNLSAANFCFVIESYWGLLGFSEKLNYHPFCFYFKFQQKNFTHFTFQQLDTNNIWW